MLGHGTTKGLRLRHYYSYWLVAAFAVGLSTLAIVAGVSLFFAAGLQAESTSLQTSAAPSASPALDTAIAERGSLDGDVNNDGQVEGNPDGSLATPGKSVRGPLDNDLDNDGNPDGMADSLVGLGLGLLVLPSVGSFFLLFLYELPMGECEYYPTLGRPG